MICSTWRSSRRPVGASAFALVELLIVIVVLGLLAAIVMFAIGSTRSDSVASVCRTDVRAIQAAAEAVNTETGSYPNDETGLVASGNTANSLKSWPGGSVTHRPGGVVTTSAETAFTFSGSGSTYSLGVYGATLRGTVLTDNATAADVKAACTPA